MTTKRFAKLQVIIILMFTFTLVCNTFSWANRPAIKGGAFMGGNNVDGPDEFSKDKTYFTAMQLVTPKVDNCYHINGNSCTAVTYFGTMNEQTGKIEYDETTPLTFTSGSIEVNLGPDDVLYFKTVITNSTEVITNTSLFVDAKYHKDINANVMIGITTPVTKAQVLITKDAENSVTKMHTVKLFPVLAGIEIGGESPQIVEWSIYNMSETDTGKFTLDNIYFTNN